VEDGGKTRTNFAMIFCPLTISIIYMPYSEPCSDSRHGWVTDAVGSRKCGYAPDSGEASIRSKRIEAEKRVNRTG